MSRIFKLSSRITEMSILKQKKSYGGFGTIDLSGVTVYPSGNDGDDFPSFEFPSSDWNVEPSDGDRGWGDGYDGDTDYEEEKDYEINDPSRVIEKTETSLKENIELMKSHLKSKALSNDDLKDLQNVIDAYEQTLQTIELLKNSEHNYRIEVKQVDNDPDVNGGGFYYDKDTNEFVIRVERLENLSDIALLAHELEHANQLENGELYLGEDKEIHGYDINDEVDAYSIQHKLEFGIGYDDMDLNGNVVSPGGFEVTPDEIYKSFPSMYDHLKTSEENSYEPSHSSEDSN